MCVCACVRVCVCVCVCVRASVCMHVCPHVVMHCYIHCLGHGQRTHCFCDYLFTSTQSAIKAFLIQTLFIL